MSQNSSLRKTGKSLWAKIQDLPIGTVVGALSLVSLTAIVILYVLTPTKWADINLELIKILATAITVGILGVWVQQLFEDYAKNRESERATAAAKVEEDRMRLQAQQNVFSDIIKLCSLIVENAQAYRSDKPVAASESLLLMVPDGNGMPHRYDELVNVWYRYEQIGPAQKATKAYEKLYKGITAGGDHLDSTKAELVANTVDSWHQYFQSRYYELVAGKVASQLDLPADWKVEP